MNQTAGLGWGFHTHFPPGHPELEIFLNEHRSCSIFNSHVYARSMDVNSDGFVTSIANSLGAGEASIRLLVSLFAGNQS